MPSVTESFAHMRGVLVGLDYNPRRLTQTSVITQTPVILSEAGRKTGAAEGSAAVRF
jgi:hypothetical protein